MPSNVNASGAARSMAPPSARRNGWLTAPLARSEATPRTSRSSGGIGQPLPRRRAREDRVRARVAAHAEPLPAAGAVIPELGVRAGRIVAQVHERRPFLDRRARWGPRERAVAAVRELGLRARAAPRARDAHHRAPSTLNAPTVSR